MIPKIPYAEAFCDTWEFEQADPVPSWLFYVRGVRSIRFTARTTVFTTLAGGFVVMPHKEVGTPVFIMGYGAHVLMEVFPQGQEPIVLLCAPVPCLPPKRLSGPSG